MKGDFSRLTHARGDHYRRVLMQQGRVEIDADGNEQVAITDHIDRTTTYDVIGESGYPLAHLPDGTPAGGFQIGLASGGGDLTISKGRMYVEGVLIENDLDGLTFLHQPDVPRSPPATAGDVGLKPGIYVVYLDVWERLITALDNPLIRETALGGPDTSVRSKVVWQAKLVPAPETVGAPTCATVGDRWRPSTANQGKLAAKTGAPRVDALPCILPPETGYRRLENQLYRVEIHKPGGYGTATFKWSRENGSIVAGVLPSPGAGAPTVAGPVFTVTGSGRDASLGFKAGDWVELTDDHSELVDGRGELLQVQGPPTDTIITTAGAAAKPVTLSLHPKLRRWDQGGAGLGEGIPIIDGSLIELEDGVEVQFTDGTFNTGDYWTIPARTKTNTQQGHIEWPVDAALNPVPLPPAGIIHRYAKLALVDFTGEGFAGVGGSIPDCRIPFPPLTEITASTCQCTITAIPGPGWELPILALFASEQHLDAQICFPVGEFPTNGPVVIKTPGNLKVSGAGWGSRITTTAGETALRFEGCASVAVSDLFASAKAVDGPDLTLAGGKDGKGDGVLEFKNCGDVQIEHVSIICGGGAHRGAACVAISTDITDSNASTGGGSTRIRASRIQVGHMQVGVLLIHQERATVEDNEITVAPATTALPLTDRLKDPAFLAGARALFFSGARLGAPVARRATPSADTIIARAAPADPAGAQAGQPRVEFAPAGSPQDALPASAQSLGRDAATAHPPRPGGAVTVRAGNQVLSFNAHPGLQSTWQTFLDQHAPKELATQRDLLNFVNTSVRRILTDQSLRAQFSGFNEIIKIISQPDAPVAQRGIAVGGRAITDLRIHGNTIKGVLQGIAVGVSHQAPASGPPDHTQTISIDGNTVEVVMNIFAKTAARYGIFVGNVNSLQIDNNHVSLVRPGASSNQSPLSADGIRVWGYLGKKLVIRQNHVQFFTTGIRVVAVAGAGKTITQAPDATYITPIRAGSLWLVADNALESTGEHPIEAPACLQVNNVN